MDLHNPLSVPRGLATFARKWVRANCLASDSIGDCVYITGDEVGDRYQVAKCDPKDELKMPSIGMIVEKESSTVCKVWWLGELDGLYTGLTHRKSLFVGVDGRLAEAPPDPDPSGYAFAQTMGTVTSSDRLLLLPNFHMVKRIG